MQSTPPTASAIGAGRPPSGSVTERFVIDGSPFPDRDAFDLLDDYFAKLDRIVTEAEKRF